MIYIRKVLRSLPSLLIAFIMAVTAWLTAVSNTDPNEVHIYNQPITVEFRGQDTSLIVNESQGIQIKVTINAPKSVWQQINTNPGLIHAYVDLSGLSKGAYELPVKVTVNTKPVQVMSTEPSKLQLTLEPLVSTNLPIQLVRRGEPAIGYMAENATMEPGNVNITGPKSLVDQVARIRAVVDLTQARESINTTLRLSSVDINGDPVDGISITPDTVVVNQPITPKGGYRNVVVKVVSQGNIANGYRLTNISVVPPNITVFSSDPSQVDRLPGYVETEPILLDNMMTNASIPVDLSLPQGVSLVGNQVVLVMVSIEPVQSSLTLTRVPVVITGLSDGLAAEFSPQVVDILISGPLPVLDILKTQEIHVELDLSAKEPGIYQIIPDVQINSPEIRVESVIPGSFEVTITRKIN